jgi:hypothetical protein
MCEGVEEFETLPSLPHRGYLGDPAPEPEDPEETELDGQILAGLVLPV